MTKLYLTRHGETEWNTIGRIQGWKDSPLTELGVEQAKWLSDRMKNTHIDVIYSSPAGRAYDTAKIIKGDRDIPIIKHDDLRELNIGAWEGLTQNEIKSLDEENLNHFWTVPSKYSVVEGGESFEILRERVFNTISKILKKHDGKTIMIVTHTIALKGFMSALEERHIDTLWEPPFIKQTSLTEIDFLDFNDMKYNIVLNADINHHKTIKKEFNQFSQNRSV